ncbi:hypothetical protein [Ancylobacter pratisalsi]|uniref:Uncharacterized protein n=1 Tax=Ancylobacter pratisalsi TaxID=1745854 RepID=A0A6P1YKX3_9HYPH|nr:hypothetical protein [Ancylobacter pratisalsi]QIB33356.1 hypothetical protein G3A50_06245 [Ancylobacter pratisalsi]
MPLAKIPATPLARFHGWLPGRVLLPLGFAAMLAVGTYLVGTSPSDPSANTALNRAAPPDVVRVISSSSATGDAATTAAATAPLSAPTYVRAIAPDAVYRPTRAHGTAEGARQASGSRLAGQEAREDVSMPSGVERFDDCGAACDTRDPLVVHSSYPAGMGPSQAQPQPAKAEDDQWLDLPAPGEMFDRAVEGTEAAYDTLKDAVGGVVQRFR